MLWKVENTPHKLLGSAHVLPPEVKLPDWVLHSGDGMKRFVFESDISQPPSNVGIDHSGKHLKLPKASLVYERARLLLLKYGVRKPIEGLLPWKAAFFVTSLAFQKITHLGSGVETRLLQKSKDEKILIEFLELNTRSSELYDLTTKSSDAGLAFFESTLAEIESGAFELEFQELVRAWITSDLNALAAILNKDKIRFPFMNAVAVQRNREWVMPASRMMREDIPTLFTVGCFHMVGEGNFIEQMESAGFSIKFIA